MREEVEMLEHHPHLLAVRVDIAAGIGNIRPLEADRPGGRDLQ